MKKQVVILESDFQVVEVDGQYIKISKALYRRLLVRIAELEYEIKILKLELEKK